MNAIDVKPTRSEHGAERRQLILDATVQLLTRDGIGAVTHRAVAREAQVPLAATTYYFDSKDSLVTEAVELLVNHQVEVFAARAGELGTEVNSPDALATGLADLLVSRDEDERHMALAQFEVYLEAARRPALRDTVERWSTTFTQLAEVALTAAGAPDPEVRAPILVAGIDGILMHGLKRGLESPDSAEVHGRVERFVLAIAGSG